MTNDDKDLNQAVNTNQTIYRQPTTDYGPEDGNDKGMEPSVFLTKEGAIGFNHYGKCAVKSIKEWVEMAWNSRPTPQQPSEKKSKAEAIHEAIRNADVGDDIVIHNEDMSVWCILNLVTREHPERESNGKDRS